MNTRGQHNLMSNCFIIVPNRLPRDWSWLSTQPSHRTLGKIMAIIYFMYPRNHLMKFCLIIFWRASRYRMLVIMIPGQNLDGGILWLCKWKNVSVWCQPSVGGNAEICFGSKTRLLVCFATQRQMMVSEAASSAVYFDTLWSTTNFMT